MVVMVVMMVVMMVLLLMMMTWALIMVAVVMTVMFRVGAGDFDVKAGVGYRVLISMNCWLYTSSTYRLVV